MRFQISYKHKFHNKHVINSLFQVGFNIFSKSRVAELSDKFKFFMSSFFYNAKVSARENTYVL